MSLLTRAKGAIIQDLDVKRRMLTITVQTDFQEPANTLTLTVDQGALVATKQHQLMRLEDFQIGHRVSVIYSREPDGTLLAKTVILERRVCPASDKPLLR